MSKGMLGLFLSLSIASTQAVAISNMIIWQCNAHDFENTFIAYNSTEWSSLRDAIKLCKKDSKQSRTCRVSREDCDALLNGQSIRPWWQCRALDSLGYVWIGNFYRVADTAIEQVKDQCHSFSAVPTTCYAYFFACKKLNPF